MTAAPRPTAVDVPPPEGSDGIKQHVDCRPMVPNGGILAEHDLAAAAAPAHTHVIISRRNVDAAGTDEVAVLRFLDMNR